jgi:hypothetical protein
MYEVGKSPSLYISHFIGSRGLSTGFLGSRHFQVFKTKLAPRLWCFCDDIISQLIEFFISRLLVIPKVACPELILFTIAGRAQQLLVATLYSHHRPF